MSAMNPIKGRLIIGSVLSAVILTGCVSESKYQALQAQNQQQAQQISRLQGAIKYTVNSDLLFPSGGWQMSAQGQQVIAKLATKLAPTQQNNIVVNGYTDNTPIGPELQKQGITSNQILSEKRAENVREYLISQGFRSDLVSAKGWGDADPVATNDTPEGRAQNRRVELTVAPPSS
jgi:chemotaxis protein MotB